MGMLERELKPQTPGTPFGANLGESTPSAHGSGEGAPALPAPTFFCELICSTGKRNLEA